MNVAAKHVTKISDLPDEPHYVIITQTSIHVPGDERSRTNPGHGYPASTEYFLSYEAFGQREAWEAEIDRLSKSKERFRAFAVSPAKVNVTTTVHVAVGGAPTR